MIQKTTLVKMGGSIYLRITPAMLEHLEILDSETDMVIKDEQSGQRKFISAWVYENE